MEEEEEEKEDEDWESLQSNCHQYQYESPSSQFSSSDHPYRNSDEFFVFPPISHEGLAVIPSPPRAPICLSSSDDSQPSSPSQKPHFPKLVDFGLELWNSKVASVVGMIRDLGFWKSASLGVLCVPFLVVLWVWVRRRYYPARWGGKESVEKLKSVIKEKDEKIIQLLQQIRTNE